MKAVVLESAERPVVYKEIDKPVLEAGEVLVQVKAAALNRRDYWITIGQYAGIRYPSVLGSDGAGIVVDVADETDKHWLNQEVIINPSNNWGESNEVKSEDFKILGLPDYGTLAEYVKVKAEYLHHKPAHLNWEQAAAIPLAGLTAYRALFTKGRAKAGDKVLIVGVGSGTGTFALQWAVSAGCKVFVTSGSGDKIDRARHLGAAAGVNYKAQDWAEELKHLAVGFDVVIDSALGNEFTKIIDLCNPGARIVTFGGTAGNIPAFNARPLFWKQLELLGTTMGTPQEFEAMLKLISDKQIVPVVDEVFAMADAQKAFDKMKDSSQFGKLVLTN
ncbi:quinone oxidoreductase family protein [Mucilaginibacter sp. KACC 22063]|uniref:quinone oxidoreductase family protein n=1 Tax=Mucilaginibacter sp. KACC 22063 TaxID=3025666 RepID=UPI002366A54E|nr:zinc-binding dehydrogenase [Mucilaginibacter sp. KACC 22063]WDF55975.1 zinc-binding dehydrogenase [Mucilaginibacter sp. KACC 22063]